MKDLAKFPIIVNTYDNCIFSKMKRLLFQNIPRVLVVKIQPKSVMQDNKDVKITALAANCPSLCIS